MDESYSPTDQQEQDADSPVQTQEPPPQTKEDTSRDESSSKKRIDGLMSLANRRLAERDEARSEVERLRAELDARFAEPKPWEAHDEADASSFASQGQGGEQGEVGIIEPPPGPIDRNRPPRSAGISGNEPGTVEELRRALDERGNAWLQGLSDLGN